ncbi:M3 family oligoendopeptidase [Photobacterium alginatilyticum]|uniref:M3 family oligoendopeptidase n=1 Tax=Photobacterium alginatilyticum TaxID=1775171 RepID=A0ABW9YIH2_9GAMM|nr:M3 family oligoendopeptidase [Photobacterium alginatilyticum]NBI53200.1 M3 family oligoendopeptidase [Photobacterium alginatilyticum]
MRAPSWDLAIAYESLSDPKISQDMKIAKEKVADFAALDPTDLGDLMKAIALSDQLTIIVRTLSSYANCLSSVDASDDGAKKLAGSVDKLFSEFEQAFNPFIQALIHLNDDEFNTVLAGNAELGELEAYRFKLERERLKRNRLLSVAEEQLLSAMNVDGRNAWGRLYDNLTGSLSVTLKLKDGSEETMGLSQAASILYGPDSERREPAWKAISEVMCFHEQSFAAILNGLAGGRLTEYEKRSHTEQVHFLDSSLHSSRIEKETLEAMFKVARDNQAVGRKAGLQMAKLFGTEKLKPWDELASMPAIKGGKSESYSFEQGISIIREAFAGVDPEMADFVDMMVERQLIDAAPQPTKRLGAYCTKFVNTRTPLVFMTWGGSMSDVLTLAHELGHAFHNWVMRDMPVVRSEYPMTLAETASIFAENIVRDALLENAESDRDKLMMLWEEAQATLALMINIPVRFEFEQAFYEQREQGEFTPAQFRELMAGTWREWYGEAMDETNDMFWASKLHFSIPELSFYNYPYLFGYLFSKGVYAQRAVKGEQFYADYKALLRDTGSMTAEEVVQKHLGMDIRQPEFWQQSVDMISAQIDAFEQLIETGRQ